MDKTERTNKSGVGKPSPLFSDSDNRYRLITGDCVDKLKNCVEDESIDLTVTSPPYSDMRNYKGINGWNISRVPEFARTLLDKTKYGGVCVWIVDDKTKNGSETGDSFRTAISFIDAGWNLNDTMIFRKTNPMPQVRQPRYSQCFEYMFVFSKGRPKTFNPIMVQCKCAGQNYDSTCKNMSGDGSRTEKHFKVNSTKVKENVWDIAVAQNKTEHPAVFPYSLAEMHIKSWSSEGDLVLDPFMGSGTTGMAALDNGRRFIGIEIVPDYVELSKKRIEGHGKI